jgi:GT2 family glycosyltransferase
MVNASVILINYNNSDDTVKCIQSIPVNNYIRNIIIIDNHSKESDIRQLENYLIKGRPGTVLLKNNENVGFGKGCNRAFKYLMENDDGEYILVLNNDTIVKPGAIEKMLEVLAADKKVAIAVPRIVYFDDPSKVWYAGGEVNWYKGLPKIYGYGENASSMEAMQSRYVTFATGCAMLIRSSVLRELGGFHPSFFLYVEDLEFSLRCTQAGWQLIYVPEALIEHKCQGSLRKSEEIFNPILHPKNRNLSLFVYHVVKNVLMTMSAYARGKNRIKFMIGFPVFWIYKNMQYLIHGRFDAARAFWKGIIDFVFRKTKNLNIIDPEQD